MVRTSATDDRCRKCSISRLIRSPRASRTPSFRAISILLAISLKSFFHDHRSGGERYFNIVFSKAPDDQGVDFVIDCEKVAILIDPEEQRHIEGRIPERGEICLGSRIAQNRLHI